MSFLEKFYLIADKIFALEQTYPHLATTLAHRRVLFSGYINEAVYTLYIHV